MSKVVLKGHIVVSDEDLSSVQAELPQHIELTRQEEGCLVFQVTQNSEDHSVFNVYEEFVNRDAFEAHQERVKSSSWGRLTENVERHYKISERD